MLKVPSLDIKLMHFYYVLVKKINDSNVDSQAAP
jgi:hypothetical protein